MHDFRAKMRDFAPNPGPICVDVPISAKRVFQENVLPKLGHPTECTLVPFFKLGGAEWLCRVAVLSGCAEWLSGCDMMSFQKQYENKKN
jgi:hypothetical protein